MNTHATDYKLFLTENSPGIIFLLNLIVSIQTVFV